MKSILTLLAIVLSFTAKSQNSSQQMDTSKIEFRTVQIQAQFPGGSEAWGKYLKKHLHAGFASQVIKLRRHQEDSIQTVRLAFLVDTLGQVIDVTVLNSDEVHPLVAKEAARVIAEGPKWTPAVQNGKKVIYKQRQSIGFLVTR